MFLKNVYSSIVLTCHATSILGTNEITLILTHLLTNNSSQYKRSYLACLKEHLLLMIVVQPIYIIRKNIIKIEREILDVFLEFPGHKSTDVDNIIIKFFL
jgi:hypothetical protein